jgi:hypothetical protein
MKYGLINKKQAEVVYFKTLPAFVCKKFGKEAARAPEPVWTQRLEEKIVLPLPGIKPRSPGRPVCSQTLY